MKEPQEHPASLTSEIGRLMAEKLSVEVNSPEEDLLAAGLIDSLSLIQLLVSLEERFEVRIPLEELEIDDVRSIQSIARLVEDHQQIQASVAGGAGTRSA
jgi:acyl carrier protein